MDAQADPYLEHIAYFLNEIADYQAGGSVKSRLRVLIAEDAPVVREGLRTLLELGGDIEVIGEAADGLIAVQLAGALLPDLVVMDLNMPVMDGYEAAREMRRCGLDCAVPALSVKDDAVSRARAQAAGMVGLAPKAGPVAKLVEPVHRFHR